MDKTVVVAVERRVHHRLYHKSVRKLKKFKAHDESNEYRVGDLVRLLETRPWSKTKRWRVTELLHRQDLPEVAPAVAAALPDEPDDSSVVPLQPAGLAAGTELAVDPGESPVEIASEPVAETEKPGDEAEGALEPTVVEPIEETTESAAEVSAEQEDSADGMESEETEAQAAPLGQVEEPPEENADGEGKLS
jgi:small subunit ribosomal protein S17